MGAGGPVGILGYHLVIPFYVKLYYKEQPIQLLNTTFPQIVVATTIFFEAYGATIIQGRQLFKEGNYCFFKHS